MSSSPVRNVRTRRQAMGRRLPERRDDSGLTTLEWLLIVAAVAGLAALAVVLVQNVVSDTSEQIAGSSARRTAAEVAASSVESEAKTLETADTNSGGRFDSWQKWINYFDAKCERIGITYSDAGISMDSEFLGSTDAITPTEAATADESNADAAIPNAKCNLS